MLNLECTVMKALSASRIRVQSLQTWKKKILQVILTWIIIIGCAINSENVSTINCMPTEKYSMTKTVQATAVSTQTRKDSTS